MAEERLPWESDQAWALREAFLQRNRHSEEDEETLIAFSHVFVNVRLLGCTYSEELMNTVCVVTALKSQVSKMGAGVEASSTLIAPPPPPVDNSRPRKRAIHHDEHHQPVKKPSPLEALFANLKAQLLVADDASAMSMLSKAAYKLGFSWELRECGDSVWEVRVGGSVVLRHAFRTPDVAVKLCAVNAVVDTFLKSSKVELKDDEVWVDGAPPSKAYTRSLERNLRLAAKYMPEPCNFKQLEEALDRVNLSASVRTIQLKRMEVIIGDALVASRDLSKAESIKSRMAEVQSALASSTAALLRQGFRLEERERLSLLPL